MIRTSGEFASRLRAVRKQLGISQREFVAASGIPMGTLRHWEAGHRLPDAPAQAFLVLLENDPEGSLVALMAAAPPGAAPAPQIDQEGPDFIADRCDASPDHSERFSELWASYLLWCAGNDVTPLGRGKFADALTRRGFSAGSGAANVAIRRGLALKPEFKRISEENSARVGGI